MSRALFSKKEIQAATDAFIREANASDGEQEIPDREGNEEQYAAMDKAMRKALVAAINYESNQLKKVNQ